MWPDSMTPHLRERIEAMFPSSEQSLPVGTQIERIHHRGTESTERSLCPLCLCGEASESELFLSRSIGCHVGSGARSRRLSSVEAAAGSTARSPNRYER